MIDRIMSETPPELTPSAQHAFQYSCRTIEDFSLFFKIEASDLEFLQAYDPQSMRLKFLACRFWARASELGVTQRQAQIVIDQAIADGRRLGHDCEVIHDRAMRRLEDFKGGDANHIITRKQTGNRLEASCKCRYQWVIDMPDDQDVREVEGWKMVLEEKIAAHLDEVTPVILYGKRR